MMPVRYISVGYLFFENFRDLLNFLWFMNNPYPVTHSVFRNKIIHGFICLFPIADQIIHGNTGFISQKYIARLCARDAHMIDPVQFLFRTSQFMLFNNIIFIIGY